MNRKFTTAFAIAALCFFVYLLTLAPTVYWYDSGELITSACTLSVAHTPGAAPFNLLAKLFILLPFGSAAYKVNLFCAVMAALTIAVVYLFFSGVASGTAALIGAFVFAFSRQFWNQATFTDLYTLHLFLVAVMLYAALRWEQDGQDKWLGLGGLALGIATAQRTPTLIYVPALVLLLLFSSKKPSPAALLKTLLLFLMGLAVLLYVPFRASFSPALNTGRLSSAGEVIGFLTGHGYKKWLFALPWGAVPMQLWFYGNALCRQFTLIGVAVGLWGCYAFFKQGNKKMWLFLTTVLLLDGFFYIQVYPSENRLEHFFLVSFLVFSLWVGMGTVDLLERLVPGILLSGKKAGWVGLILPLALLVIHWQKVDKHDYMRAFSYASGVFDICDKGAIVITDDDNEYHPLKYMKFVEKVRPDVDVYHTGLYAEQQGRPWVELLKQDRPVYLTFYQGQLLNYGYRLLPQGLLWKVVSDAGSKEQVMQGNQSGADKIGLTGFALEKREVKAGQVDRVGLWWKRIGNAKPAFAAVFIFLNHNGSWLDRQGKPFFLHLHSPLYDRVAPMEWPATKQVREEYYWVLRDDLEPGDYEILVGVRNSAELLHTLQSIEPDHLYFDNYDKDNPDFAKYEYSMGGWERGHSLKQLKEGLGDWIESSLAHGSFYKVADIEVTR